MQSDPIPNVLGAPGCLLWVFCHGSFVNCASGAAFLGFGVLDEALLVLFFHLEEYAELVI
ncbi:unnamed protein product [Acidithrix sp. C25]|nr:unnamed protein product [Acidithrix sp. C25]